MITTVDVEPKLAFDFKLRSWVTAEPILLPFELEGLKGCLHIAEGMPTDGASVPRAAWIAAGERMEMPRLVGAIGHDALYLAQPCSRALADKLYRYWNLKATKPNKRPKWKVKIEYVTLFLFGWKAWNTHVKAGDPENWKEKVILTFETTGAKKGDEE